MLHILKSLKASALIPGNYLLNSNQTNDLIKHLYVMKLVMQSHYHISTCTDFRKNG